MDEDIFDTSVDLNVDAYIPDSYISNEYQKLDIYKRIAAVENEEEMDNMLDEPHRPVWGYPEKGAAASADRAPEILGSLGFCDQCGGKGHGT